MYLDNKSTTSIVCYEYIVNTKVSNLIHVHVYVIFGVVLFFVAVFFFCVFFSQNIWRWDLDLKPH